MNQRNDVTDAAHLTVFFRGVEWCLPCSRRASWFLQLERLYDWRRFVRERKRDVCFRLGWTETEERDSRWWQKYESYVWPWSRIGRITHVSSDSPMPFHCITRQEALCCNFLVDINEFMKTVTLTVITFDSMFWTTVCSDFVEKDRALWQCFVLTNRQWGGWVGVQC